MDQSTKELRLCCLSLPPQGSSYYTGYIKHHGPRSYYRFKVTIKLQETGKPTLVLPLQILNFLYIPSRFSSARVLSSSFLSPTLIAFVSPVSPKPEDRRPVFPHQCFGLTLLQ